LVSAGDSESSNTTDPTVVLPPVQEMRSRGSTIGQYAYKGKRRSETLSPDAKSIGIKIFCIALGIGLIVWFITTPDFESTAELTPPDAAPLLTAPEDPAPAANGPAEAAPPGDTGGAPSGPENGSEGATGSPESQDPSQQPLPSCQDQEPSAGNSGTDTPSPPERDPDGEVGMMEVNSSNENDMEITK
jgi:hypothetical protein